MNIRKALALAVAAPLALGLTACNPGELAGGGKTVTKTATSSTPSSDTASNSSTSSSSTSSTSSSSTSSSSSSASPTDKGTPIGKTPRTFSDGPMTKLTGVMAGGYRSYKGSKYAKLYAVLKMDATGPGLVNVRFLLKDANGKVLGHEDTYVHAGKGTDMIKVVTHTAEAPEGVKRVDLEVLSNTEADSGEDMTITNIQIVKPESKYDRPIIKGRYTTHGDGSAISANAVCWKKDDKSDVYVGSGVFPAIKAKQSDGFKVTLYDAPEGWVPKDCYVGQG